MDDDTDDIWFQPPWADLDAADATPLPDWLAKDLTPDGPLWRGALTPLLGPLCAAQDALARLDAAAAWAPPAVRDGLIARLALREASGWLAYSAVWVHPLDLALRAAHLTSASELAVWVGRGAQTLPHTTAAGIHAGDSDAAPASDRAIAQALQLARLWERLAQARTWRPLATPEAAHNVLDPLGFGALDPVRVAAWHGQFASPKAPGNQLPPLLTAAWAAERWMESGVSDTPAAAQAVFAASLRLSGQLRLQAVAPPFWGASPALTHSDADGLPQLRQRFSRDLTGAPAWPLAFLRLVAEGAQAGTRELIRLNDVAAAGAALTAKKDPRSQVPAAVAAVLRAPILTSMALARQLAVAPQTATRLLRSLAAAGIAREVTGRKSFRAFAA